MRINLDKVQLRLDPTVILDLRRLANYDDRSMSNYIHKILKDHVKTMRPLLSRINNELP
jgi:hypothetical protein